MESLYGLYGKAGRQGVFSVCVVPGGHSDKLELRLMAYRWMNRHLKGDSGDPAEPKPELFKLEELRVFPEDSDIPSDELNTKIDETFVPFAEVSLPRAEELPGFKNDLLKKLRDYSFRAWPEEYPAGVSEQILSGTVSTEPPVYVEAAPFIGAKDPPHPWLIVLNPDEAELEFPEWARELADSQPAVVLRPRGVGPTKWTTKNPPNYVERSLVLLGRTVDSGRVWDVRVAAFALKEKMSSGGGGGEPTVKVGGKGEAGILAAYAALFEPAISEVVLVEPPETHMKGPHFLNVLRVLDIPDALGLLAPRKLTIVGARAEAFAKTAALYKIAGAGDRLLFR
jgi:hypothetical protein